MVRTNIFVKMFSGEDSVACKYKVVLTRHNSIWEARGNVHPMRLMFGQLHFLVNKGNHNTILFLPLLHSIPNDVNKSPLLYQEGSEELSGPGVRTHMFKSNF